MMANVVCAWESEFKFGSSFGGELLTVETVRVPLAYCFSKSVLR
jgi:hypothetical protein